jgi:hypothetical protein
MSLSSVKGLRLPAQISHEQARAAETRSHSVWFKHDAYVSWSHR